MTISWDNTAALSQAHAQLLAGRPVGAAVRNQILTSWRRSQSMGVSPDILEAPYYDHLDIDDTFTHAARPVLERLESSLSGMSVSVLLSDERARLVERRFGDPSLNRYLDRLQVAPGFAIPERIVGTNGIGTALAMRKPAFVCGREHFADALHGIACAAAPVRDPLSGRIIAVLDLTCLNLHADPTMLGLVSEAVRDIEQRLLNRATSRERALLEAFHAAQRRATADGFSRGHATAADLLDRHERHVLEEQATELISLGRTGVIEVPLSRGRTAALFSRSVESPSGVTGFAVEAVLPGGELRRLATTEPRGMPAGTQPGTAQPTVDHADPAAPRSARSGRWLLAVGEPEVGRFALRARRRLELLCEAGARVGTSLNVVRTAEELAEVAVPRLADFAAVDLPDSVALGEDPIRVDGALRRVAIAGVHTESHLYAAGDPVSFARSTPQARSLLTGEAVLEPVLARAPGWTANDPVRGRKILDAGVHSLITVPMLARGTVLGVVSLYRSGDREPFEEDDVSLAEELVGRAAVSVDNARRFTRERAMALTLQRSLLPRGLPDQRAVEAAHRYLPAKSGVGGDWFDVIPLSGARVALVVGDVVGHGLHAAATMGRLRTAVHNFSALDLAADEILTQLDDLVCRLDQDQEAAGTGGAEIIGASCLYAVYDPVTRRCTLARAGHPPPAVVLPDGTVDFPDLPAGPPLGLGGLPFETAEIELPEGSLLVLYTDGLIDDISRSDADLGLARLRRVLARPGRTPEESCEALLSLLPAHPADDVAILVARTRALGDRQVAMWYLPGDPAVVSRVRAQVTAQLAEWHLEDLEFATELVVSELVTNAIRYGGEPIQLRLLRDRTLICEVADGSSTSPRLRRARTTDEGGRGLFLVAQLTQHWGTRYSANGKVIWTEQALPTV